MTNKVEIPESYCPRLPQIIQSPLDNDFYKISMGQVIYHQFPSYTTTWTFKCRNPEIKFSSDMVMEIADQIQRYCRLRFAEEELSYLASIKWLKPDYIAFLRLWRPNFKDFEITTDGPNGLTIEASGTWLNTSMYEVPVLAIVNEVYFRMFYNAGYVGLPTFKDLEESFDTRLNDKYVRVADGRWRAGTFSEFGTRRRLSRNAQAKVIQKFAELSSEPDCTSRFIGTSNMYFAKKFNLTPVGTMAHELIMCIGQGNFKHNPAYSNWYALNAWVREYGILNGIALTDTVTTDCFLKDFRLTYATLFSGVRHDSGDPIEWGEKMLRQYRMLGIDTHNKTLLFSDSLDFKKADRIFRHFQDRCQVAFGIGTYLANDTCVDPLNIVMKVTKCNGQDVAKLSDADGKSMCKNPDYVNYLRGAINWRMTHET